MSLTRLVPPGDWEATQYTMVPVHLRGLLLLAWYLALTHSARGQDDAKGECAVLINYGANLGYGSARSTIDDFSGIFAIFNNQSVRSPAPGPCL